MDSTEFKAVLGLLPTGVTIITTVHDKKLFGFTANSFTSVSLTPPLVSFCLDSSALSITGFSQSESFVVSVLAENQSDLAEHFARHSVNKFINVPYSIGHHTNCPLIKGSVCHIECNKVMSYTAGDHILFIGEVIHTTVNNRLKPLIYFMKSYTKIQ